MSKQTEALRNLVAALWAEFGVKDIPDSIRPHYDEARRALSEEAQPEPVASLRVMEESDPTWRGRSFIGLTDAGRALPAGDYRLYAQPVPALPEGWQPIETAPKDGTTVFAHWSGQIGIAMFYGGHWRDPEDQDSFFIEPTGWLAAPPIAASEEKTE